MSRWLDSAIGDLIRLKDTASIEDLVLDIHEEGTLTITDIITNTTINISASALYKTFFIIYAATYYNPYIRVDNAMDLDLEFYLNHSGEKWISPLFSKLIKLYENVDEDNADLLPIIKIVQIAHNKFSHKWDKIYDALLVQNYDMLANYGFTETHTETTTEDNTITKSINESSSSNGSSSENTNITTTDSGDVKGFDYGYNTNEDGVQTDKTATTNSSTTTGSANDNKIENESSSTRTGNNVDVEDKGGTRDYTKTISGYEGLEPETAIENEIKLRDRYLFYNIIYKDVDSLLTLKIY